VGLDDHISSLCSRLLNSSSDEEAVLLASELKAALHDHVESLRTRIKVSLQPSDDDEFQTPAG
jgi:hypothetical protein